MGSEMCIRDRTKTGEEDKVLIFVGERAGGRGLLKKRRGYIVLLLLDKEWD